MVMLATRNLPPAVEPTAGGTLVVRRAPDGRLTVMSASGCTVVRIRQCFPWSEPARQLSLRDADDNEVAFVDDPVLLDEESREALAAALAEASFVLDVAQVLDVEEEVEIRQWTVLTRHGKRLFQTHLDDWPRMLPGGGFLIRDVAGDLYRFSDPSSMDKRSRDLLWAFVD